MITNITTGVDPSRIQNKLPSFFVSWIEDGKQNYKFFAICSSMYRFAEILEELK